MHGNQLAMLDKLIYFYIRKNVNSTRPLITTQHCLPQKSKDVDNLGYGMCYMLQKYIYDLMRLSRR